MPSVIRSRRAGPWILLLLSLLAGLRVFLLSAASPFFAATDEPSHYDTVWKYAHGHAPRHLEPFSPGAARERVLFRSFEVMSPPPAAYQVFYYVPRWKGGGVTQTELFREAVSRVSKEVNIESVQPPVYYTLAAGWYRLGELVGLRGGWLLYWIRFLNVGLFALLVPLTYGLARACYRNAQFLPWTAAVLIAVCPQNVFFSISNDVLSPVLSAAALLALVRWRQVTAPSVLQGFLVGALAGLAVWSKLPNVLFLVPVVIFVLWGARAPVRDKAILLTACCMPLGGWMLWNLSNGVDLTNSASKVAILSWVPKPYSALWQHPLFTWDGAWLFWSYTVSYYWNGEAIWHGKGLTPGWYRLLTVAGISIVLLYHVITLFQRRRDEQNFYTVTFLLYFLSGFVCLAALSLRWDFGMSHYPSREYPYFTSGRLILGSLVPFVIIAAKAVDVGLKWLPEKRRLDLVVLVALAGVAVQGVSMAPLFSSPFNWFHLQQPSDPAVLRP